jgi:rhodanese-related sulfurtransferase
MDARRFEEFQAMSIPTATSVPGGELVLRAGTLAPRPETQIIVNCAGRTRSIIGTQSLINAGFPNPVAALRDGTIGWRLAGQLLDHGQSRKFPTIDASVRATASAKARRVADLAGVKRIDLETTTAWAGRGEATVYLFDVRTPAEYQDGHLPGFRNAPGGQLVQETDVLTASWLAQMGWKVFVLDPPYGESSETLRPQFTVRGPWHPPLPRLPILPEDALISAARLKEWLRQPSENLESLNGRANSDLAVLDVAPSPQYAARHIPGSWFVLRSKLTEAFEAVCHAKGYVLTSPDGIAAHFAWPDASKLTSKPICVLEGGTDAWFAGGQPTNTSRPQYASQPIDRYKRPYEGVEASADTMQAYLDWEGGLVDQLKRDGTHGFYVI